MATSKRSGQSEAFPPEPRVEDPEERAVRAAEREREEEAREDSAAKGAEKGRRVLYRYPINGGGFQEQVASVVSREGDVCVLEIPNRITGRSERLENVPRWRDNGTPTSPAGWFPIVSKPKAG